MAVPEQTPYIEHTGNGVTTSFALGFQCETKDHLIVLVDEIEPPIETWSLIDGNVIFTTAPAAGKKITAQRNTPFSRTTDYQSYNNSFRPPAVNKDFDWIWLKLQELGVADWILGARIDALKNYVDRKDDELKAYLMEEIRKQGVALDQLDEYYNYLMQRLAQIAVDKGWDASFVVDASGKTQQEINNILKTQSVNIKQFENALTDFSLAYYNALEFCRTNAVDTVYVPDGNYYANNSVQYTLNKNIRMVFGTNVKIYQRTHNHVFDITQSSFTVEIDGNGAEIYPDWSTAPETDVIALKFNGWTSKRNFTFSGMNVLANPATSQEFTWAFHGLGLNYAGVGDSLFQAKNSVYFGSQPAGDKWTRAMGAEFSDVRCLASNIGVLVVNQGTYAAEGFKYKGGEILADVGIRTVDNIPTGYYPPLFTVTDTHINARLALDLNGISRVQIKADIQAYVTSENTANGLIELSGVQELIFDGSNVSHAVADDSAISDAKPIFHIKSHPQGKISAFFNLGANNYWLSYAGTKLISFESDAVYSGEVALGNFPRSVFASKIVDKAYAHKISAAESLGYEVADINSQLALSYDATFAGGVLTLGNPPLSSGIYVIPISVVPSGATITQIKCESRQGKLVDVVFEGENITFTHNANFFQPTGMTWRSTGARMGARIYFLNQNVSYIVATTGLGCFSPVTSVPANSSVYGQHGQKIFSAGFVYEYISGTGWVKYAAATF
ncbi:hypothetical protein [Acinetobacter lwoffii]|uniref:hypothetical protein n=1 Tax=Acinetobacter lwoffii TaxID=28090 RepID=UPI0021FC9C8C|nr:hypothetical protein ABWED_1712 [Acinetobacter lwoffii]